MTTTSSKEQIGSSVLPSQLGSMQTIVLVLLGLVFLTSKLAGILVVVMLGIIIHNSNHFVGSSGIENVNNAVPIDNEQSGPSSKTPGKAAKEPNKAHQQDQSPLFAKLPVELRIAVYKHLLVSELEGRLLQPNELISENASKFRFKEFAYRANGLPGPGIDSTFLRCCRRIYEEALPVLYGDNIFKFSYADEIREFRSREIVPIQATRKKANQLVRFNLRLCSEGRLSMICKLELKFEGRNVYGPTKMDKWEEFLIKDSDEDKIENVRFPKLETLLLDFEAWQLHWDHRLVIHPFVYMFRGASGLKSLVVAGVENEDDLERFKRALLREGGEFFPGYPPVQRQINKLEDDIWI